MSTQLPPELSALMGGPASTGGTAAVELPPELRALGESAAKSPGPEGETSFGKATRFGRELLGGAADVIDLGTVGLPAMAAGTVAEGIRRVSGAVRGEDRRQVAAEGAQLSGKIGEQFGTPIRTTLTRMGVLRKDEPGAIPQALETLMSKVEEGARAVEKGSDSWILKEDVMMTFNGLLGALGIKGIGAGTKAVMKAGELRRANAEIQKQLAAAEGERFGREVAAGEKLAEAEAINRPVEIRADTPQAVSDIAKAERKLRAQKRADVRAAFAGDPSMTAADRSSAGWELSEADRTQLQAEGMAEARERARAEAEGLSNMGERAPRTGYREGAELDLNAPIERPITTPDGTPFGTAEQMATQQGLERRGLADTLGRGDQGKLIPNTDALNSGLAKVRSGRLFDLTSEERVALRGSSRITDPKVITAAAVGATGLGLALTMEPSAEEAALAIGAGALAVGRGRGPLTLEAIRSMPDAAPHKIFKDASPYTLSTLEMLPENAFDFSKTQVQQLLKRQEVTKMERGILESALAAVPGDRITAKQLWTGVKEATGDFELKKEETQQFASYGLENIGRLAPVDGIDRGVWIPENATPEEVARLEAENAAEVSARELAAPISRTTIYQSPIELGTANHFNDPNYFAHTRSFDEGGVRHVVEMQSDLAQKAGKVLTPEERIKLQEEYLAAREEYVAALRLNRQIDSGQAPPGTRRILLQPLRLRNAELEAKIATSTSAVKVSPMLKDWHKRLIREEMADSAAKGEPVVRFADADTVAKVEGWPDRQAAWDNGGRAGRPTESYERPTTRFSPEHQGIYDRYAKDVTKFLKQLDGKHVTDSAGHGWYEVPIAGNSKLPGGGRRTQIGSANTEIMSISAAIGGGTALGAWLADEENKLKGAITGGITGAGLAILGLSRLAKSPSPAIRDSVAAVGRAAEYTLGTLSTRIRGMSESVLRRLDQFEKSTLVTAHDALVKMEPFVAGVGKLKSDSALSAAILSNSHARIAAELGRLGKPELIQQFRVVRAQLDKYGEALRENRLLKGLRQDYFPRIVTDYEGLMEALGADVKTALEKRIAEADVKAVRTTGQGLSPVEISAIVNDYLSSRPGGGGKSRFLRERKLGEISPELAKFYAPPAEGLMLYARAAAREIEKAKFFGKHLIRSADNGRINLDSSVGNLLFEEQARGKIKPEDFNKLKDLLHSRFGPGERAMAVPLQNLRNWSNAMLLGHVTSAAVQLGDVAMSVPLHGLLPTIKSLRQVLTRSPDRISVTDLGLVDHVIEEFSGTLSSAKILDKVFKFSGFSLIDQLGKTTLTNAAINKFRALAKSEVGRTKIAKQYGDYFGKDLGGLIEELQAETKGPLTLELAFRELADAQPITKIEVPQAYLDNPNGRVMYQLKTFAIKQMDLARRKVWQQLRGGNPGEGIKNALRIGATLALAGASADMIRDFILGRERERDWGDLPLNLLKTYGMSSYMMDKIRQGKGYETLIMSTIAPPWKIFEQVYHADPRVLENTPIIGKFLYWRLMGGAEAWNEKEEKRQLKEDRQSE